MRAYDLDHEGDASNERVFVAKIEGVPGGMRVDEKGNLYVAANGDLGLFVRRQDSRPSIAMHERAIELRLRRPDGMTLFITARGNLYRARWT